jgi:hypothetical protein
MIRLPSIGVCCGQFGLTGLAVLGAITLSAGDAKALLIYNIFESGGNVVIQSSGSLQLSGANLADASACNVTDLEPANARFCTGVQPLNPSDFLRYSITGPASFSSNSNTNFYYANSSSGILTLLYGGQGSFSIASGYVNGTPIVSSATYNGKTLADLGFSQSAGLIGSWTLSGSGDTINVVLGPAAVPGPLPLFGTAAAFGWSRRLRRRIGAASTSAPEN